MSKIHIDRSLLIAITLALASCAALIGLWYWLDMERRNLAELKSVVGASTQTQASIQGMRALVRDTEEARNELRGYLLNVEDPAPFLELVEGAGEDTGVTLSIVDVGVTTENGRRNVNATFEFAGSFEACYRFLRLLEHLPYAASLSQASLVRDRADERGGWAGTALVRVDTRP